MCRGALSKISDYVNRGSYYQSKDLVRSYRDFGVPYSSAVE